VSPGLGGAAAGERTPDEACQPESFLGVTGSPTVREELDALPEPPAVAAASAASAADDDDDADLGVGTPSELSAGFVFSEPSPDAHDGASTRLSTPSSSAPFTDTRLSPAGAL
jgi:hypothetical protein